MDELIRRQLLAELRRAGYAKAYYSEEHNAALPMDKDFPDIQIRENEIWMPRLDEPEQQQQRDMVYDILRPIADKVDEMVSSWRKAFPMRIPDVNNYRLFSEYGKHLLAARDDGERGLYFVTWEYNYNRSNVAHGHYMTDFKAAKQDFAVRSGLFPEKMVFVKEELSQIYSALIFKGKYDDELSYEQSRDLNGVIEKLERIDPNLKKTQELPERENEPEPEQ